MTDKSRITEEIKNQLRAIMAEIQCPKDFQCAESGFDRLCKAEDFGLENYLKCLELDPSSCAFALPFGEGYFCQCQLRVFLSKELKK